MQKRLNFRFARIEIIQFVQYPILKKKESYVNIFTTKKRSNSKEKIWILKKETYKKEKSDNKNPIICDRNEKILKLKFQKARPQKAERSNLCRLIKKKVKMIFKKKNHKDGKP